MLSTVLSAAIKWHRVHTDPGKSWKMHRSWKIVENSWNSKVVVLENLLPAPLRFSRDMSQTPLGELKGFENAFSESW